jgi:hypothetical protein
MMNFGRATIKSRLEAEILFSMGNSGEIEQEFDSTLMGAGEQFVLLCGRIRVFGSTLRRRRHGGLLMRLGAR